MKTEPLELADYSLVEVKTTNECAPTPHCKKHGAMNKVSVYKNGGGAWRCVTAVNYESENTCRAGCSEVA